MAASRPSANVSDIILMASDVVRAPSISLIGYYWSVLLSNEVSKSSINLCLIYNKEGIKPNLMLPSNEKSQINSAIVL